MSSFAPSSPPPTTSVLRPATPSNPTRVMPSNVTNTPSTPAQAAQPGTSSTTPAATPSGRERQGSFGGSSKAKHLKPFNTANIKILLLENVNQTAVTALKEQGYQVETYAKALSEEDLIEKIKDVHCIGIRSKTKITKKVLDAAEKLGVIGCFCIGTNQVDLEYAASKGVAVFNSPFSNSRSVAELVIAEIVLLSRQLGDRNNEMHQGNWQKVSANCYEIRGKTLGIVGYGHIGSQLSVMAEAMGMKVYFHDVVPLMPLGTAKQVNSLDELLSISDFVTLHVPETEETKNMIGEHELKLMKQGSFLINASRGTVVQIPALAKALRSGHLGGAAVDVFPKEPAANGKFFESELMGCPNTLLTPHIGGSTEEAQSMIGVEVSTALIKFINNGTSVGAVNFPEVDLRAIRDEENSIRLCYTHMNVPGVLGRITNILADHNVDKQFSDSKGKIAYLMADISDVTPEQIQDLYQRISETPTNIVTRILY
ncbi:Phosphoglycerate dehydrogenase ser3 [Actinomortierella wolfii]|nr:Phosphoglycerate dehydrogenase ser3 [Actinomortierella wolfii]KAG0233121.1 Phosphoglycerate dehydrogenase ser3 [Actinomortierella wolfii]